MYKKIISLIISVCMLSSLLPFSGEGQLHAAPVSAEVISNSASITDASYKNSGITVFNIQDLHFNREAQNKIFSLLEKLNKSYPEMELYVEGASESNGFEWVYSSLGKKNGDIFVDALFKSGNISGAEYFAAKNGKTVNAVEDKDIYTKNLLLFAQIIEKREEINSFFKSVESSVAALGAKYLTAQQRKLYSSYQKHGNGVLTDAQYCTFLKNEAAKYDIDINDYPNIALYLLTSGQIMSVNQKKLQEQMAKIFTNLKSTLSHRQYSELISLSNNLQDRQTFIAYLYQNREQVNLQAYPELSRFISSIVLSEKLNPVEFISEENSLVRLLSSKISNDGNSQNIFFISLFLETYKKVLTAAATEYEYRYYKSQIHKFRNAASRYISSADIDGMSLYEKQAEDFNETNLLRNEIFIGKIFGSMKKPSSVYSETVFGVNANSKAVFEKAEKSKVKVIVAGGFHTAGINDILNKSQISNVTFTPKVLASLQDYSKRYVEYARTISYAENNAIPEPVFGELTLSAFAKRILDTLYTERTEYGWNFSDAALKKSIEDFIEQREEVSGKEDAGAKKTEKDKVKAAFSYDEASDTASIIYTYPSGRQEVVKYEAPESLPSEKTGINLSTLGNFTVKTVQAILNNLSMDFTNTALNWMYKTLLDTGVYKTDEEKRRLKLDLQSGEFDLSAFFSGNAKQLQAFVINLFMTNKVIDVSPYKEIIKIIESDAQLYFPQKVRVVVSDTPLLISEDGWCFAAYSKNSEDEGTLFIHTALMDKLIGLSGESNNETIVLGYINALLQHESFENSALFDAETQIYQNFGTYLRRRNLTEESRMTEEFHKYLESDEFKTFLSKSKRQNLAKGQELLLEFADELLNETLGRHEGIRAVAELQSFSFEDPTMLDLLHMRMGDPAVMSRYKEDLKRKILEIVGESGMQKSDFAIAFRKTTPAHIMERIAKVIAKETGISIIFIEQDKYMDIKAIIPGMSRPDDLPDRLKIGHVEGETLALPYSEIGGKNVILLEDTCKTGKLFGAQSKVLNNENVASIIPITIFDIRKAVDDVSLKTQVSNADFEFDQYLKEYIKAHPKEAAQKIIDMDGYTSKYMYYALMLLVKDKDYAAFEEIAKIFNEKTASSAQNEKIQKAKHNFIAALIEVQGKYPEMASSLMPLVYSIYTADIDKRDPKTGIPVIFAEIKSEYKTDKKNTVFNLKVSEYKDWDQPWLIPLFAYFNGYTKIVINFPKKGVDGEDASITRKRMELLRDACKALNINCLSNDLELDEESSSLTVKDKRIIRALVKRKKIALQLEKAREEFNRGVLIDQNRTASENYRAAVKAIMREADLAVRYYLSLKRGHALNLTDNDYTIVTGGSFAKGSSTSESDIYYDFIFSDRSRMLALKDILVPAYEYALQEIGIQPYLANGYNFNYLGADVGISPTFTQINMNTGDERAIAAIFDFDPIYADPAVKQDETIFSRYRDQVAKSGRERFIELLPSLKSAEKVYSSILRDGNYSIESNEDGTNLLTFFDNYYASSFVDNNSESMQYDYRWVLRGLELALKEILIHAVANGADINFPTNTEALINSLFIKKLLPGSYKHDIQKRNDLINAWSNITVSRQKKVAEGKEYEWTPMTEAERRNIAVIRNFMDEVEKEYRRDKAIEDVEAIRETSRYDVFQAADKYIASMIPDKYKEVVEKLERYEYWTNQDGSFSVDTALALMFSSLPYDEIAAACLGFQTEHGYDMNKAVKTAQKIATARTFPQYKDLDGDFTLQNYMDAIISIAGDSDGMTAIFADKLQELINAPEDVREDLKVTFFTVYIPLARRLNANNIFEEMRNAIFGETQRVQYNETLRIVEEITGFPYDKGNDLLNYLEEALSSYMTAAGIKGFRISKRLKTIYSIFEKSNSTREIDRKKIEKGVTDILGMHIVVPQHERDNALNEILWAIDALPNVSMEFMHFDPQINIGYARTQIKISYNNRLVGEIVLYSGEQYEIEHYGILDEEMSKYTLPHWIYKLGKNRTDTDNYGLSKTPKYADGVFEMQVSLKHLLGEDYSGETYSSERNFFFYSDNIVLDADFKENFRRVYSKISERKRIFVSKDGKTYIIDLPRGATAYDLMASERLNAEGGSFILKNNFYTDPSESEITDFSQSIFDFASFTMMPAKENIFEDIGAGDSALHTLRAKMMAKLGRQGLSGIGNIRKPSELSDISADIISIYAHTFGLADAKELYYVLNDPDLRSGFVTVDDVSKFAEEKKKIVYQLEIVDLQDLQLDAFFDEYIEVVNNILRKYLEDGAEIDIKRIEAAYRKFAIQVTFSGVQEDEAKNAVAGLISESALQDINVRYFLNKDNEFILSVKKSVYRALQALGENVYALLGNMQEYPLEAGNALASLFESSKIEDLFFDGGRLILKSEAEDILADVKDVLKGGDEKYGFYDTELVVSDAAGLIKRTDAYALATMTVDDEVAGKEINGIKTVKQRGKITLYINEAFLRALENLNDSERAFYLKQLAVHEGSEFLYSKKEGSAKGFHSLISDTNPAQAKLMEFAAKVAGKELESRNNAELLKDIIEDLKKAGVDIDDSSDVKSASASVLNLLISSLKGVNLSFPESFNSDVWIRTAALLENSKDKKEIRKMLLDMLSEEKSASGEKLFSSKNDLLEAVRQKSSGEGYLFETIKTFADFIYYGIEQSERYSKIANEAMARARFASATPSAVRKGVGEIIYTPQYLKDKSRTFVFDIENPEINAELIAYMGGYASKSFAVSPADYISDDDVLFSVKVNIGGSDLDMNIALEPFVTDKGIFYNMKFSLPFIYDMPASEVNGQAKTQLLAMIYDTPALREKILERGLDLRNMEDMLVIERIPSDKRLSTVQAKSMRIAEAAGLDGEISGIERRSKKSSLYNEKLNVGAMLRSGRDSGIGEITSLNNYIEDVLKTSDISGFTMRDLFIGNALAGNYLLLDWLSVPEAMGIVSQDDVAAEIGDDKESVDRSGVAKRKTAAALRVYARLDAQTRNAVEEYYKENAYWLDSFAKSEAAKYSIGISESEFVKIMAMQQLFFDRQLKQTLSQITDMHLSMSLEGIDAGNAESIILKWISLGITSFIIDMDKTDPAVLKAVSDAVAKSGYFANVSVRPGEQNTDKKNLESAISTILGFNYAPVITFQNLKEVAKINSRYRLEIDDASVMSIEDLSLLINESASSGASTVDYPIGLLWNQRVSEKSMDNYRVPAKGTAKFGGINFGIFKAGQITFEESYTANYLNAVERGINTDVSDAVFNVDLMREIPVRINGADFDVPAVFAAVLLGSFAKQERISEIADFEIAVDSIINEFDKTEKLKAARTYLEKLKSAYSASSGKQKEINAAKIAGFVQGLYEKLAVSAAEGSFTSKAMGSVYANLTAEYAMFKAGYVLEDAGAVTVERVLAKVEDILGDNNKTFAAAAAEIEPVLLNLMIPMQKAGFTFEVSDKTKLTRKDEAMAKKISEQYSSLATIIIDLFIDKVAVKNQIKKSTSSTVEAARRILAAA